MVAQSISQEVGLVATIHGVGDGSPDHPIIATSSSISSYRPTTATSGREQPQYFDPYLASEDRQEQDGEQQQPNHYERLGTMNNGNELLTAKYALMGPSERKATANGKTPITTHSFTLSEQTLDVANTTVDTVVNEANLTSAAVEAESVTGSDKTPDTSLSKPSEPLSAEHLEELQNLQLYYPGLQRDYKFAQGAFHDNMADRFHKAVRKLKEKQRVYDQYRSFTRLNELASLELAYPGHDEDLQEIEKWHLSHPPNDENDALFKDKLDGLRNKDALFFGDRSHPNVVALDGLVLTYPNWESDLQEATAVHCDQPGHHFPDKLHMLREKQRIYLGDRAHWRLQQLDNLQLTYPGWENDVQQVQTWHIQHADTPQNTSLFAEVIEGMRDQQIIFLGWDGETNDEDQVDDDDYNIGDNTNRRDDTNSNDSESPESSSRVQRILRAMESRRKNAEREAMRSSNDFKTNPRRKSRFSTSSYASSAGSSTSLVSSGSSSESSQPYQTHNQATGRDGKGMLERRTGPPTSSAAFETDQHHQLLAGLPVSNAPTTNPSWLLSSPSSDAPPAGMDAPIDTSPTKIGGKKKSISLGKCIVCLSRTKTHVFVPCGHLCCCAACATHAMETGALCPICRSDADNTYRVFY